MLIFHRVDFSHFILLLSTYWILSIINQALSKTKELPEIESRYFATEEEFSSLLASWQFIKAVILTDVCRYRFYAIPKLCIIAEFFTLHIPLALCPVWSILWGNECCIPSIDFWTTLPLIWTPNAISCNTLGIYFLHEIFIQLTKKKILTYAVLCNIPCNLIYSLFILFGSLIITLLMKKTPILKYLVSWVNMMAATGQK